MSAVKVLDSWMLYVRPPGAWVSPVFLLGKPPLAAS